MGIIAKNHPAVKFWTCVRHFAQNHRESTRRSRQFLGVFWGFQGFFAKTAAARPRARRHSGAFMLSTIEIFFSLRPISRLTIMPNSIVSARAYTKLEGSMVRPNITASTSTV